jgi:hypothetical protein
MEPAGHPHEPGKATQSRCMSEPLVRGLSIHARLCRAPCGNRPHALWALWYPTNRNTASSRIGRPTIPIITRSKILRNPNECNPAHAVSIISFSVRFARVDFGLDEGQFPLLVPYERLYLPLLQVILPGIAAHAADDEPLSLWLTDTGC